LADLALYKWRELYRSDRLV